MLNFELKNLRSERSNKPVTNQIMLQFGSVAMFSSYGTLIAIYNNVTNVITKLNECYKDGKNVANSRTTMKYFNQFVTIIKDEHDAVNDPVTVEEVGESDFNLLLTKLETKLTFIKVR